MESTTTFSELLKTELANGYTVQQGMFMAIGGLVLYKAFKHTHWYIKNAEV